MTLLLLTVMKEGEHSCTRIEHGIRGGNRAYSTGRGLKEFGASDTLSWMLRWSWRGSLPFPNDMAFDGTLTQFIWDGGDMTLKDDIDIPTLQQEIAKYNLPVKIEVLK